VRRLERGAAGASGGACVSGVSVYFSRGYKLLCFFGLRAGVKIGRRIGRVVFTICVSLGAENGCDACDAKDGACRFICGGALSSFVSVDCGEG